MYLAVTVWTYEEVNAESDLLKNTTFQVKEVLVGTKNVKMYIIFCQ